MAGFLGLHHCISQFLLIHPLSNTVSPTGSVSLKKPNTGLLIQRSVTQKFFLPVVAKMLSQQLSKCRGSERGLCGTQRGTEDGHPTWGVRCRQRLKSRTTEGLQL